MRKLLSIIFLSVFLFGNSQTYVQVLGVAQDGGYPHLGCQAKCCEMAWENDSLKRFVVSLALVDPSTKSWWLFEATPDIKEQLHYFRTLTEGEYNYLPNGIFITHAHIGHYTGLMQLGREVFNTKEIPVYVLPKLKAFLETNGPWSQLVALKNISITELKADSILKLNANIKVEVFKVPHRDEYSETAGFKILSNKKYLFIPDIDKWEKWDRKIVKEVGSTDYAFIDATFNDINELKGRKISEVPHPFVSESVQLFEKESAVLRSKIVFIHFNHTNPLMWDKETQNKIKALGYRIAEQGKRFN
jgi:pyrroloquinoline quinone biosynthesis protein B